MNGKKFRMVYKVDGNPQLDTCDWSMYSNILKRKLSSSWGHFPLGGIFRAERHFLLFKDQLAESGRQKTEEILIPRGKFRLVENGPYNG